MQEININLGGVTRVPDDVMALNGDLAVAVNLASDGDGLKMLEKAENLYTETTTSNGVTTTSPASLRENETVLCVHQNDGYKHYITKYNGKLWWRGDSNEATVNNAANPDYFASPHEIGTSSATQATVMGNTVITQGTKMEYWLWDKENKSYKALGQRPPMVNIQFGLNNQMTCYPLPQSDPIELWGWWYASDVPIPFVTWTEDVHAYTSRMPGGTALKPRAAYNNMGDTTAETVWEITTGAFPNLWDFSLEHAVGASNESESKISECVDYLTDSCLAWINKFITKKATDENKFVFPFFIRYCYEMYDGTQMMVSDPVLLIPSTHAPQFVILDKTMGEAASSSAGWLRLKGFDYDTESENFGTSSYTIDGFIPKDHAKTAVWIKGRIFGIISQLRYRLSFNTGDYASWKDLIKSVGVYVSPPIYTYDQSGKVYGWKEVTDDWAGYFSEGDFTGLQNGRQDFNDLFNYTAVASSNDFTYSEYVSNANHFVLKVPEHSNEEIRKKALETSQYFKIAEFDYEELVARYTTAPSGIEIDDLPIDEDVLNVLTNRRQLMDDFVHGDDLSAETQYVYNRRLHLANVTRTLRDPLDPALQVPFLSGTTTYEANETVRIDQHVVETTGSLPILNNQEPPLWLFYPNKNARDLWLDWNPKDKLYKYKLSEHNMLDGAYFLSSKLWTSQTTDSNVSEVTSGTPPSATDAKVTYEGEVWTSNVENPFVFEAGNVNQVGDGKILALRAAVAPLAEDQHGYAPMYVFTSQGVWAMTHSKDGTPAAIDHICGDIITEGTEPLSLGQSCLVMTDRGLLELAGRSVRNLGEKIDGRFAMSHYNSFQGMDTIIPMSDNTQMFPAIDAFAQPLRGLVGKFLYDYKHQRVYVFLSQGSWVLNLRTGLWTQSEARCSQVLNAYPSCEYVDLTRRIVTLDGDSSFYNSGLAVTRPIKLTEAQAKLREVAVRGFFNPDSRDVTALVNNVETVVSTADLWTVLHGSRDWHNYGLVASSKGYRITRLGGSAYRSHVLSVILRNADATIDRVVLTVDQEQGNRLR